MDYLLLVNWVVFGEYFDDFVSVEGFDVVIIGGGDIGVDCFGMVLW